ncbi:MAG: alpha/beta fold hydrolase [Aquabacterium sp.]
MPGLPLPAGVRSRQLPGVNGLDLHLLEAGFETPGRPCVLLLHGFPELAYSWRRVLPALAAAGYHAVAPDQRGYGRTAGGHAAYDGDIGAYRMPALAADMRALVQALGRDAVQAVVGHDFGSPVAAWCALLWPQVFRSVVLMSAPWAGPPSRLPPSPQAALQALVPPRQHYQWYYATRQADADMRHCPQGLHAFLRAYYHHKSADWPHNRPHPLASGSAEQLARMPTYYIMALGTDMAATVAPHMPTAEAIAACAWLPDAELAVYAAEYQRTGFQGGLQWYRCAIDEDCQRELLTHAGRTIDVPALYIAGAQDWGTYQKPGAFEAIPVRACTQWRGSHLVPGAGHWVQQEQPRAVNALLLRFLDDVVRADRHAPAAG